MASIEKHSSGKWKIRYRILGTHRAEYLSTRQEANARRAEIELALARKVDPKSGLPIMYGVGLTSEEAIAKFRVWSGQQGRAPRTLERDIDTLVPFLTDCPDYVTQIRIEHITNFITAHKTSSASTYNNAVNAFRAFWKFLAGSGFVKEDITTGLKRRKIPRSIPNIFTSDEIALLIEAMPAPYKPFTRFVAVTGCRVSEAINLLWRDVELPRVIIRAPKEKHDKVLVLPPSLSDEIADLPRVRDCSHVFVGCRKKALYKRSVEDVITRAGERAGLPPDKCHWHNLRHTAASNLVLTLPVPVVQKLLGHRDIKTTERYLHIAGVHLAEAATGALQDYVSRIKIYLGT